MNVLTKKTYAGSLITPKFKKVYASVLGAAFAVSCMAMNAFASSGTGSSNVLDTVTSSMTEQLIDLVTKAGVAIAAVVGIGLTIFGAKWIVTQIKSFFKRLT